MPRLSRVTLHLMVVPCGAGWRTNSSRSSNSISGDGGLSSSCHKRDITIQIIQIIHSFPQADIASLHRSLTFLLFLPLPFFFLGTSVSSSSLSSDLAASKMRNIYMDIRRFWQIESYFRLLSLSLRIWNYWDRMKNSICGYSSYKKCYKQTAWIEYTCIADTYSFSCYSSLCPYYSCLFSCLFLHQLETWRWSWQWISFCSCWV